MVRTAVGTLTRSTRAPRWRWAAATAILAAAAVWIAGPASPAAAASAKPTEAANSLHATLLSSEPGAGATVENASRIRLVFSEPVEASLAAMSVTRAGGDGFALGHRVDGSFDFTVGRSAGSAGEAVTSAAHRARARFAIAPTTDSGFVAALGHHPAVPVLRAVAITSLLAVAGLTLLIATLPISGPRPMRLALILSIIATVLLATYAIAWSTSSTEGSGMLDSISLTASTTPGALEIARIALAVLALWSLALARRPGLAALFSGVAVLITGASGHPAVISPMITIPAKSIHLAAAAVWMGGLLWIVTAERHGARYVEGTRRISSLAFISVIVVLATGILQTVLFLPRLSALNGSTYGQLVLYKFAGLLVLVLFGMFHRRAIPRLDTTMARRRLRGSVRFEIVVMLAVGILGGLLAAIESPR